jgi:hypothetical protein
MNYADQVKELRQVVRSLRKIGLFEIYAKELELAANRIERTKARDGRDGREWPSAGLPIEVLNRNNTWEYGVSVGNGYYEQLPGGFHHSLMDIASWRYLRPPKPLQPADTVAWCITETGEQYWIYSSSSKIPHIGEEMPASDGFSSSKVIHVEPVEWKDEE